MNIPWSRDVQAVGWFVGGNMLIMLLLTLVGSSTGGGVDGFSLGEMTFMFLLQQVIVFVLLGLAYIRWKADRGTYSNFVEEMKDKRQWKGRFPVRWYVILGLVFYFIGMGGLAFLLDYIGVSIPGLFGDQGVMDMLAEIDMTSWFHALTIFLLVVILGPFLEEIVFRGFITDVLMKSWGGVGVAIAALIFAVAHMERAVLINLSILAWILGYIYWKTGSMWYSFLFHVVINGVAFMLLLMMQLFPDMLPVLA